MRLTSPPSHGALAAGPGIRYGELAAVLRAAGHDVTLAAPEVGADTLWSTDSIASLAHGHSAVVLGQGHADLGRAIARELPHDLPIVVDCYAPGLIEAIALNDDAAMFPGFLARTVELLRRGDLFLVANAPQRLYTLGLLSAAGRLNPATYANVPLLDIPFEYLRAARTCRQEGRSRRTRTRGRGARPLVRGRLSVVRLCHCGARLRACARAGAERLVRDSRRPPPTCAPRMHGLEALAAARELGIANRVVEAPWGPYDQRIAWYAEADCAICLHHRGLEAELAHRTRLVDMLWGRVPVVSSAGDVVGELATAAGAGISVPIADADAAGAALTELLLDPDRGEACRKGRRASRMTWPGRACWRRSWPGSRLHAWRPTACRPAPGASRCAAS